MITRRSHRGSLSVLADSRGREPLCCCAHEGEPSQRRVRQSGQAAGRFVVRGSQVKPQRTQVSSLIVTICADITTPTPTCKLKLFSPIPPPQPLCPVRCRMRGMNRHAARAVKIHTFNLDNGLTRRAKLLLCEEDGC